MEWTVQSTLNLIRENLNDRYRSGFPVIQELVQNADDAQARRLDIGWTVGLPGAQHPLLQGPAIFVANDGTFSEREALAINSIALSSKSGEQGTIGKFGLGLKSIFHLCEAFFYTSFDGTTSTRRAAIVNPWADAQGQDVFHTGWDDFCPEDQKAVLAHLQAVLPQSRYLCLWIPLRRERHYPGKNPITRNNLGDSPGLPESLKHLDVGLALLLPLLSCLEEAHGWTYDLRSGQFAQSFRIRFAAKATRRRYPQLRVDEQAVFGGEIEQTGGDQGVRRAHLFTGVELLTGDQFLAGLKKSALWPHSSSTDPETGDYRSFPDKADPHCAVYFLRSGTAGEQGRLDIRQSVFLPVGDPADGMAIAGDWSYQLVLHGYFFVDAGRSRLEGWEQGFSSVAPTDEASLRRIWNSRLAREGTLPLVLPALERFVARARLSESEIRGLTESLKQSTFLARYQSQVCSRHQWLACLTEGKLKWQLAASDERYFLIPKYSERIQEALPGVAELSRANRIASADAPRITDRPPEKWSLGMLLAALQTTGASVLGHAERLAYVNDFLELCHTTDARLDPVDDRLCSLAREGFRQTEFSKLRRYREEVARYLQFIPDERKLTFREASAAWDSLVRRLLELELEVLVVPGGLGRAATEEERGASARIRTGDGVRLLRAVAEGEEGGPSAKAAEDVCRRVALDVLRAAEGGPLGLLRVCADLPLFRGQIGPAVLTWNELQRLNARHTLFRYAPGTEFQELQRALPDERVVLLDKPTADTLFGERSGPTRCDAGSCITALRVKPRLGSPEERKGLLQLVQNQVDHLDYRTGVRYLLHGQATDSGALFAVTTSDQTDVWAKLLRKVLALEHREWSVIPGALSSAIAPDRWQLLGILPVQRDAVVQHLRETNISELDCSDLSPEERETLLIEVDDLNVLRRLRIHEDQDGNLVSIEVGRSFLEGSFLKRMPAELLEGLSIIRASSDRRAAERQRDFLQLPALNAQAGVQIALQQPEPSRYWRLIMDGLNDARSIEFIRNEVRQALRERHWLLTATGEPVAPEDVVNIPGLENETSRLIGSLGGLFVDVLLLDKELHTHSGVTVLERDILPNVEQALGMLSMVMSDNDAYRVGELTAEDGSNLLEEILQAFREADRDLMPAWEVLRSVNDLLGGDKCRKYLLPGLLKPLPAGRLISVLGYLAAQHARVGVQEKEALLGLHDRYLMGARSSGGFAASVLPHIKLLNRRGQWRGSNQLCVGLPGLDDSALLHDRHLEILDAVLPRHSEQTLAGEHSGPSDVPAPRDLDRQLDESVRVLKDYFGEWENAVDREIVGGFLALLGDHCGVQQLADSYLGNRHIDETRALLDWKQMPGRDLEQESLAEAMSYQRFLVKTVGGETASVPSLIGTPFKARLSGATDLRHLLVGDQEVYFRSVKDQAHRLYVNRVMLRKVPVGTAEFPGSRLSDLLRETARLILKTIYAQQNPGVEQLWEDLAHSEQLDILIAQSLLLESAVFYLKQLGINTNSRLGPVLLEWAEAQRLRAEVGAARLRGKPVKDASGEQLQKALQQLRGLIEGDSTAQDTIFSAVRHKIEYYQYQPQSIPFELLQNADDAAEELCSMLGDEGTGKDVDRYAVVIDEHRIDFVHWGRPINEYRLGGFTEQEGRERGYDRDLEKMLVLSYSDKQPGDSRRPSVTGRFGLGFKSVFTVCTQPEVLSGRIGFRVVGGIYPKKLDEQSYAELLAQRKACSANESSAARGTVVRLSVNEPQIDPNAVLKRFRSLIHIMLVFCKRIKCCDLRQPGKAGAFSVWKETAVPGLQGVYTGALAPMATTELRGTTGLVLRCESRESEGALLLVMGARGFVPLPETVPTVWVTAPTREEPGLGFAINGPFDLDIGRAQLARDSGRNEDVARGMGALLGLELVNLFNAGKGQRWPGVRQALNLADDVTEYDFWASLWYLLAAKVSDAQSDQSTVVRSVLWGSQALPAGYGRLVATCAATPTHLWGEHQRLASWAEVTHAVEGALSKEEVFKAVVCWPGFAHRYPPGSLVSSPRTYAVLGALWPGAWNIRPLTLVDAIVEETGKERCADPATAERLGALIDPAFLSRLEREEQETISRRLREIYFRARDGRQCAAKELLIGHTGSVQPDEREEAMRAGFAPAGRVLASNYSGKALQFLRVCRGALSAPAKELADWTVSTETLQGRQAALTYLLSGQLSAAVGIELQPRVAGSWWLSQLTEGVLAQHYGFEDANARSIILGRLGLIGQNFLGVPLHPDPKRELRDIYEWWHANREEKLTEYERRVYPDGRQVVRSQEYDLSNADDRGAWLTLLLLGSLHRMGRTKPEQHRGFLEMFRSKGWLRVFADADAGAVEWMRVLDEYLEVQNEQMEYYEWVRQFVPIYHISRCLSEYHAAFMAVQSWPRPFALDQVTALPTSEMHQRGGPNAPSITKVLGIGACFVMRELVRSAVITSEHALEHCFVPSAKVRQKLISLGCPIDDVPRAEHSPIIYRFLAGHLGNERATFDLSFDLPFLLRDGND